MNDGEAHLAARFKDRRAAGRALAVSLANLHADLPAAAPLVLALPRGGVPVAFEVAAGLGAPLDLQLVRKVGAPGNPEFGLGAVADGSPPIIMIDDALVRSLKPPPCYVEAEIERELAEMTRRRERYLGDRPRPRSRDGPSSLWTTGLPLAGRRGRRSRPCGGGDRGGSFSPPRSPPRRASRGCERWWTTWCACSSRT